MYKCKNFRITSGISNMYRCEKKYDTRVKQETISKCLCEKKILITKEKRKKSDGVSDMYKCKNFRITSGISNMYRCEKKYNTRVKQETISKCLGEKKILITKEKRKKSDGVSDMYKYKKHLKWETISESTAGKSQIFRKFIIIITVVKSEKLDAIRYEKKTLTNEGFHSLLPCRLPGPLHSGGGSWFINLDRLTLSFLSGLFRCSFPFVVLELLIIATILINPNHIAILPIVVAILAANLPILTTNLILTANLIFAAN